jgi:hypothetical protein
MKLAFLCAVAAAVLVAACGSQNTASTIDDTTSPPLSGATAHGATIKTLTVTAPTTPSTPGTHACTAATLSLSFLGLQGATGHGELGFELRNSGSAPCHTYGFPGIQFLSMSGAPLPTSPMHTTHDFFGTAPERVVTLAPGQSASFRLGVLHGAASPAGCVTTYGVSVIPPDDTVPLHVSIPDGATECNGTVTVSPLQPGTSAFP